MNRLCLMSVSAIVALIPCANAEDGSAVFSKNCAKCHGATGKGDTPMGKKLSIKDLGAAQAKLSDAQIEKAIKEGVKDGDKQRMKPLKEVSDADIKAVIKHLRTLK